MNGEKFSYGDLKEIINDIIKNNLSEAEVAYFVAVQNLSGMDSEETIALTKAMIDTGISLDFKKKIVADKHCIGGIAGNRTTPLVVSICAAAGLTIPKSSTKAITSASGTIDVIETITSVEFDLEKLKRIVKKSNGCFLLGGSLGLSPSDEKIIRIERLLNVDTPTQMIASVLSKKISVGSKYLIIDIPYGKGAKVSTINEAKKLGKRFREIAREFKLKLKILYTDGKQPIGNGFGPVLEMKDVLLVLKNSKDCPKDLKEKSLYLSSQLMALCGIRKSKELAKKILEEGTAYKKFKEIIDLQNGEQSFDSKLKNLKIAKFKRTFNSSKDGKIKEINNKKINKLCRILGSPDTKSSGIYLYKHIGKVKSREKLITLYSESKDKLKEAIKYYKKGKILQVI
jgi:thymidine phosphorylase